MFRNPDDVSGLFKGVPWYRARLSQAAIKRVRLLSSGTPPIETVPEWVELESNGIGALIASPNPDWFLNLEASLRR